MTSNTVRQGRLLLAVVAFAALMIVGALWLRAITIDQTTDRICDKVDRLTAALISASRGSTRTPPDPERIQAFVKDAACDPANLLETTTPTPTPTGGP